MAKHSPCDIYTDLEMQACYQWSNVGLLTGFEGHFASALEKAPLCTQVIYRGILAAREQENEWRYVERVTSDDRETLTRYASASTSKAIADQWSRPGLDAAFPSYRGVLIIVNARTARHLPISAQSVNEEEVVLRQGSTYEVTGRRRVDSGDDRLELWEVEWTEVP